MNRFTTFTSLWTALKREQLGNSSARPNPRGVKAVRRRDQKQKRWGQHDVEVQFMKAITDITGTSPQRRRNFDMPVGYSGRAALRREQYDMT
jgi:hypothetical protein